VPILNFAIPEMRKYFINSPGKLKRLESTVYFEAEKDGNVTKKAIPINDIDCLYIFSEVDLNTKFLNFISQYDIVLHIFNYYGFYSGSFLPRKKNVSGVLLVEQVKYFTDNQSRHYIATCFIEGAIFHIIRNLRKYSINADFIKEIEEKIIPRLFEAESIEQIMAVEGNVRQKYYQLFNSIINNDDFYMHKRVKRPPDNPINALISFGNSVMYTTVLSEILKTQLDPTISYLHAPTEKRFSLSLDIAEIFKPLIIDPIIFSLVNTKALTINDFDKDLNYAYLNQEGRTKFLKAYEEKLATTVKHRQLKRNVSYQSLIRHECYKLIKHFISDAVYKPFKAWW
jgi:CRISPR-associated protein Cas1